MRVAVYGTEIQPDYLPIYHRTFAFFNSNNIHWTVHRRIKDALVGSHIVTIAEDQIFDSGNPCCEPVDYILSIGGDGTFLNAVGYAMYLNAPIIGVNCGRLGFLADISSENLESALRQLVQKDFVIEQRSLIEVIEPEDLFGDFKYALNELTVHKLDNSSMIKIATYINGEFLSNYFADGLIIGTPTGSTAYSLSVGGPIVMPDLAGLIITPIAPHNLTVRPVVVPDNVEIELHVEGRGNQFLVSFDHRSEPLDFSTFLRIRKAELTVPAVKLNGQSFYSTLRNKLMWGADKRN